MSRRTRGTYGRWMKRKILPLCAGLSLLAISATVAIAGHVTSGVKSYTGCLTVNGGTLTQIKEGDTPLNPCGSGQVRAHFSGGDISKISVGPGLSLPNGGDNGEVTIQLDAKYSLPASCASEQVAKWNATTSTWVCGTDNDTTYASGTGISLDNTTNQFSVAPSYRVKNTPDCSSGQFATGFDADGDIQCATPSAGTVQGFSATVANVTVAGMTTIVSKTLPAGSYLLFGSVELVNHDNDDPSFGQCRIPGYLADGAWLDEGTGGTVGRSESISMASAITHPGGPVVLSCEEIEGNVDVEQATLSAIKLNSLG